MYLTVCTLLYVTRMIPQTFFSTHPPQKNASEQLVWVTCGTVLPFFGSIATASACAPAGDVSTNPALD